MVHTASESVPSSSFDGAEDHRDLVQKIQATCEHIREGGMVIMVDDQSRENEGDLVMAAEEVSSKAINFMAKEGRGLICLPMEGAMIERLQLPMMSDHSKNIESRKTAFTVSIEAKTGVSTGISAQDRATTIQVAIDDATQPHDLVVPGHIFPLKARPGGVLTRAGHTEGSVDLVKLAGKKPASVICEIMNDDGTMARRDDLEVFSQQHNIPIISIEEIITYRMLFDSYVSERKREVIATSYGEFEAVWFESDLDQSQHVAFIKGQDFSTHTTEVRVYRQKFLRDIFGAADLEVAHHQSIRRVNYGLEVLQRAERGVYLYLSSPPTRLASLPSPGKDVAVPSKMDARLYGIGAQILRKLGVKKLILNTIAPRGLVAIGGFGLEVVGVRLLHSQQLQSIREHNHQSQQVRSRIASSQQQDQLPPPNLAHHAVAGVSESQPAWSKVRFMLLRASWHPEIVDDLVDGAEKKLLAAGVGADQLVQRQVPGAYELLMGAQVAVQQQWDVILCFGCIIQGRTHHDEWVHDALKYGLAHLQVSSDRIVVPCVLHVDSKRIAKERVRAGSAHHRGEEAVAAALAMVSSVSSWRTEADS